MVYLKKRKISLLQFLFRSVGTATVIHGGTEHWLRRMEQLSVSLTIVDSVISADPNLTVYAKDVWWLTSLPSQINPTVFIIPNSNRTTNIHADYVCSLDKYILLGNFNSPWLFHNGGISQLGILGDWTASHVEQLGSILPSYKISMAILIS